MARVHRSTAALSDSSESSAAGPSTGLFTPVDKEPGIDEPPWKDSRKYDPLEPESRLGGRGFASFSDLFAGQRGSKPRADPSKGGERGSSGIAKVGGSTRDRRAGRRLPVETRSKHFAAATEIGRAHV